MRALRAFLLRAGGLFRRQRRDREMEEEFASHLHLHIDDNIRAGMTPEDARRQALLKFGGVEPAKEAWRDRRGLPAVETVLHDIRYAIRTMWQSRGFTAVVTLTLALGIGANTAIFSLLDAVLLKMLPVSHPEQLVFVTTNAVHTGKIRVSQNISNLALKRMGESATLVAGLGAYQTESRLSVGVNGQSQLASGQVVSGTYAPVLGIHALFGRTIGPEDDHAGSRVAQISYGYWQRRFGGDAGVIGREITVNGVPFTIVGVTPREFYGLSADAEAEVSLPAATRPQVNAGRISSDEPKPGASAGTVFARLNSGVSSSQAAVELGVILRQSRLEEAGSELGAEQRAAIEKISVELTPASQGLNRVRNRFSKPLEVLMVLVGLVMLIACANIANLMMARASVRRREIAIRLSLGSSRWRLIRQLLTESLLLSFLGTALGIVLAVWARSAIVYLATLRQSSPAIPFEWNFRLLAFTAGISLLNALLFGLAPALRATRLDLGTALKSGRTGGGATRIPLGRVLIAGQVSVSLALLIAAALFIDTFRNLDRIDAGYDRDRAILVTLDARLAGYRGTKAAQVYKQVMDRVTALHGVRAVSVMREKLLSGRVSMNSIWVPGYTLRSGEDAANLWVVANGVGPKFFATSGMRLVAGRDFSEQDNERAAKVAVVNETMARHFFGTRDPVGQRISWSKPEPASVEIVGVVRDIKYIGLREDKMDVIFTPILQDSDAWKEATLLVRTSTDSTRMLNDVRAAIRDVDSNLPVYDLTTMNRQVQSTLSQPRLMAILSSFFGFLALGLSAVGLHGVLSYNVVQRTSEIGIRMALGAQRGGILHLVLGETVRVVAIGIALGIAIALSAARLIQSLLFGVTPTDSSALAGAVTLLTAVALLAAFLPAWRASRVDPMTALRHE